MLSCVVLSISFGIYGFLEWGAVSTEVHSWADKINPDRLLPGGSTCLGSPVTAPAPGVLSSLTATSHLIWKALFYAAGYIVMYVQHFA